MQEKTRKVDGRTYTRLNLPYLTSEKTVSCMKLSLCLKSDKECRREDKEGRRKDIYSLATSLSDFRKIVHDTIF